MCNGTRLIARKLHANNKLLEVVEHGGSLRRAVRGPALCQRADSHVVLVVRTSSEVSARESGISSSFVKIIKVFQMRFRPDLIDGKLDLECYLIAKSLYKLN